MGGSSSNHCSNEDENQSGLSCAGDCKVWLYEHDNQNGEFGYACSSSTSTIVSTATNGWDGDLRMWVNDEVSSIKLVAKDSATKGCTVQLFKDCGGTFMTEVQASQGQTCKFNLGDLTPYGFVVNIYFINMFFKTTIHITTGKYIFDIFDFFLLYTE